MADRKSYKEAVEIYKSTPENLNKVAQSEARRQIRKEQGLDRENHLGVRIGLGKLVVLVLMIALLFRVLQGGDMPTFASLLERLRTMPTIVPVDIFNWQTDLGDWGLFNFLKDIFESSIANVGMLLGMISSLINCIPFVFTLVTWIFAG